MNRTTNALLAVIAGALLWPQVSPSINNAVASIQQSMEEQRQTKRARTYLSEQWEEVCTIRNLRRNLQRGKLLGSPTVYSQGVVELPKHIKTPEQCKQWAGTKQQWIESPSND